MNTDPVLTAFQTGWLAVETFGLLRRYARFGKTSTQDKVNIERRFNFTKRKADLEEQLIFALERLKAVSAHLVPGIPLPVPEDNFLLLQAVKKDPAPTWEAFEAWSSQVWILLQARDPLAGQAFTCGGDLADTYWYPQGAGAEKLADTLRSFRLRYIAERVADLSDHLPEHAALAIQHSLEAWSIGEEVKAMDEAAQKSLLARLEAQVKVWRDLLFGLRRAESYLKPQDRRQVAANAWFATAGLLVIVGIAAWLAVLALSTVGRSLLGFSATVMLDSAKANSELVRTILDWQNWSALLATVVSAFTVLTGILKGLSGWLLAFYRQTLQAQTLQRIQLRTFRDYRREQAAALAEEAGE